MPFANAGIIRAVIQRMAVHGDLGVILRVIDAGIILENQRQRLAVIAVEKRIATVRVAEG